MANHPAYPLSLLLAFVLGCWLLATGLSPTAAAATGPARTGLRVLAASAGVGIAAAAVLGSSRSSRPLAALDALAASAGVTSTDSRTATVYEPATEPPGGPRALRRCAGRSARVRRPRQPDRRAGLPGRGREVPLRPPAAVSRRRGRRTSTTRCRGRSVVTASAASPPRRTPGHSPRSTVWCCGPRSPSSDISGRADAGGDIDHRQRGRAEHAGEGRRAQGAAAAGDRVRRRSPGRSTPSSATTGSSPATAPRR